MQDSTTQVSALRLLGLRISRNVGIYGLGSFIGLGINLVNVVILTYFLDPSEFGRLALLIFFAALLTILINLGSLRGTFQRVFGSAGDEDGDEEDEREELAGDKRRALGVGLIFTAFLAAAAVALVALGSAPIAGSLLGDSADAHLVLIAAVSGGIGAVWRLVSNVPRLERRPVIFVVLSVIRPIAVLATVVPLVAAGGGIEGAIAGTAIGSAAALLVGLVVIRGSFRFGFDWGEAVEIMRRGAFFIPIALSFWVIQNGDLFMLSRFASDEDVGFYKLAGRIAAVASYGLSAFFMAWMPMRRDVSYHAAEEERGEELRPTVLTYFVALSVGLLLALAIGADLLVSVAPASYGDAAPLIPLLGGAFISFGLMMAIYRSSRLKRKRRIYVALAVGCVIVFIPLALVMTSAWEGYGAALSVIATFALGTLVVGLLSELGRRPIGLDYRRIGLILACGAACAVAARLIGEAAGSSRAPLEAGILLSYPVALVAVGGIPREHVRSLFAISRSLPSRHSGAIRLETVRDLEADDAAALFALTVRGRSLNQVAAQRDLEPTPLARRLVPQLRRLTGTSQPGFNDGLIGLYLFAGAAVAERDQVARELRAHGADLNDVARLELAVRELRALPPDRWGMEAMTKAQALEVEVAGPHAIPNEDDEGLAALQSERKRLSRNLNKLMLEKEQSFGEYGRYVVHDPPGVESNSLIFAFSSARPDSPPRHAHIQTLARMDVPTIFLRSTDGTWFNADPELDSRPELREMISTLAEERGVEPENVICCGGSAGAHRALSYGCWLGAGHIISGSPPLLLGDLLTGGRIGGGRGTKLRSYSKELTAPVTEEQERQRQYLNELALGPIERAEGDTTIHLFISRTDEMYQYCVPPLVEICERKPNLTLDITLDDYERHKFMRDRLKPFMSTLIDRILVENEARAQGVGSASR